MTSLNQFVGLLKTIVTAHEQLKGFGEGDIWEVGADGKYPLQYPFLWVIRMPSTGGPKVLNMKFSLIIADITDPSGNNELEVLSDTQQIALDIIAQLQSPDYDDNFVLDPIINYTPFTEKFDEQTAGWKVDITVKVNFLADRCAVPSSLLPSPLTTGCEPVIITDGDSTQHTIAAGGLYSCLTLPQLLGISQASVIYSGLNSSFKLTSVIQVLQTNDLTVSLTSQQVTAFIQALTAAEIYSDLTGAQIASIIALLTNLQLTANLSGAQINAIIQSLTAATIYADLTAGQIVSIIPDFSNAQINANISTAQVTNLNAANVQKLILAQIQSLVNAQLLMLSVTQLQYVLSNAMSQQFINDNLSQATRNKLNNVYSEKTGQTTSFVNGDDGYFQTGRGINFTTLALNNAFGNTNRFTDENGLQVYGSAYKIDHLKGLGWCLTKQASGVWSTAMAAYSTFSLVVGSNTFNDFRVPNWNEINGITDKGSNFPFLTVLSDSSGDLLWSSTTNKFATTNARAAQTDQGQAIEAKTIKTSTAPKYYMCRTHY